ncbi:hypothetical protein HHK36_032468 [Tetracentron sinense]|uniref:Protein kinase domain-containing protein n=1 Tax=Tetracentron sinense TaxID=13715 RepID=A0A834Y7U9_TETSI|nr:hypothetical protein HHK36_032468 [Tetracentron sinense]
MVVRYKIALGLASALLYLHEEWKQCVVHRDIKSSNVMLDSGFNAKLRDFSLARFVDHELGSQTTMLARTMGYPAPECVTTGKGSKESDVYSFGIVALEITCRRKPVDPKAEEFKVRMVEWVWDPYGRGRILDAADARLDSDFDEEQIERLMIIVYIGTLGINQVQASIIIVRGRYPPFSASNLAVIVTMQLLAFLVSEKQQKMICDCWPSWCCCCCGGSRNSKSKKEGKLNSNKKMMMHNYHNKRSGPVFDLKEIEGLEGYDKFEKSSLMSLKKFEKRFGKSPVFIASTLTEDGGLPEGTNPIGHIKEAIHVICCGYEEKTEWGKEIYGSVAEYILTGFKMHCRGWKSVYCVPERAAFKVSAPINLSDRLHDDLRWALGSVEIFLSSHFPLWYGYGGKLKWLQRLAYTNTIVYLFTSIPFLAYCTIPAVCLLSGKFIIPTLTSLASIWLMALVLSIIATRVLEIRWSGVSIEDWWRVNTNINVTSKTADDSEFGHIYLFKWKILLLAPITLIILNVVGVVAGASDGINNGSRFGSFGIQPSLNFSPGALSGPLQDVPSLG